MTDSQTLREKYLAYNVSQNATADKASRFEALMDQVVVGLPAERPPAETRVLDIGCGVGLQSQVWARAGYQVTGLDVDEGLLEVGRELAEKDGLAIEWVCASATEAPFEDGSFDVVLSIELLEHVVEWREVLDHLTRVVAPGGTLVLSTTNKLCPRQSEYALPVYSWWPAPAKRWAERAAVTSRPEIVRYTSFPAVNWFTPYQLAEELRQRGFSTQSRLDRIRTADRSAPVAMAIKAAQRFPPGRFLYHVATEGTLLYARRTLQ